jgi:hypothetical protein
MVAALILEKENQISAQQEQALAIKKKEDVLKEYNRLIMIQSAEALKEK